MYIYIYIDMCTNTTTPRTHTLLIYTHTYMPIWLRNLYGSGLKRESLCNCVFWSK